ncbi:MAG: hypothetical protein KIG32_08540, partial [Ruminiclostridium sp.]|nr:hypothetical protein [Ruminiclostridium sp.]
YKDDEKVTFRFVCGMDSKPMLKSVTETVYPAVLKYLGLQKYERDMLYSAIYGEFCDFDMYVKNYLSFCHGVSVSDGD